MTEEGSDSRPDLGVPPGVRPGDVGVFGDLSSIHLADGIGHRLDHVDEVRPEGTVLVHLVTIIGFLAVSEALLQYIEFSVLVGIPAGLIAGALVAAFVLTQLGQERDQTRRLFARALAAFGITLLVVFALAVGLQLSITISILIAIVIGVIAGIGVFIRRNS